jgi:hypothetical protein
MLSKNLKLGLLGTLLASTSLFADAAPRSPFKKNGCSVDERAVRASFPNLSSLPRPRSDGYLPWEAIDRRIWGNRDRELAVQISLREDKNALDVEVHLKNLCNPELQFALGRFRFDRNDKVHESARDLIGVHPIRLSGTIFEEALQNTEILGFLRYFPAVKSPDGDLAKDSPARLYLAIHAYNSARKAYDIIDVFQLLELKELER